MYTWTSSICVPRYRSNRIIQIRTCPFFNWSTSLDEKHLTLRQHPSICISGICNRCCIWAEDPSVVYSRCSECCARLPVIFPPAGRDCCRSIWSSSKRSFKVAVFLSEALPLRIHWVVLTEYKELGTCKWMSGCRGDVGSQLWEAAWVTKNPQWNSLNGS